MTVKLLTEHHLEFLRRLHRLVLLNTCQKPTLLEITYHGSIVIFQSQGESENDQEVDTLSIASPTQRVVDAMLDTQ